jgi:hypothetical protein
MTGAKLNFDASGIRQFGSASFASANVLSIIVLESVANVDDRTAVTFMKKSYVSHFLSPVLFSSNNTDILHNCEVCDKRYKLLKNIGFLPGI